MDKNKLMTDIDKISNNTNNLKETINIIETSHKQRTNEISRKI